MPITKQMMGLPSRTMPQAEFDAASEKLMVEFPQWGTEANALEANVNSLEVSTTLKAAAAAASALVAQTAAANSVAAADLVATSIDTRTLAPGDVTFTVALNKGFRAGMPLVSSMTDFPGNKFIGYAKSYDPATGTLIFAAEAIRGGGTSSAWTISISGPYVVPFAAGGAYADYALAADRTLSAASARLQELTPAVHGLKVNLPDATMMVPGQGQFTLANPPNPSSLNAVAPDLGVRDWAGVLKGFVLPDESVRANLVTNTTAAGVWQFEGISPIGVAARLLGNASTIIGGAAGMFVKAFPLDADRIMLLIYGVSLHAVIYNQTLNTWGAVTLLRTSFAAAGAVDNVMAVPTNTPGQLLVFSVGEGQTNGMAMVVWGGSAGTTVSPGAATTVTLGGACSRLVDLVKVGSSYVLGFTVGTTSFRFRALTTASDTPAAGAEIALATVAPPALLPVDSGSFAVMTASATVLSITPYAVAGTSLTVGTAATTTVTSAANITIKPGAFTTLQRWIVAYVNSTAKVALVSFFGSPPTAAISQITAASTGLTAITGISTVGYPNSGSQSSMATAAWGTLTTGEFGVEFYSFTDTNSGSGLVANSSTDTFRPTTAAITSVAPLAVDLSNSGTGGIYVNWQVSTAKEVLVYSCKEVAQLLSFSIGRASRKGAIPGSLALPVPAIYPKVNLPGGTLTAPSSSRSVSLGDGSKHPLYCANGPIGPRALPIDLNIPGDTANAAQGFDTSSIWMGYSQGPNLAFDLLQVRLA